ncbi:MAG: hypothetical protein AAB368_09375 [bacterium]
MPQTFTVAIVDDDGLVLQPLLDQLPPGDQLDFQRLLEAVYTVRFTGPLTIDFLNGTPRQISLGQPVRLAICSGALDNGKPSKAG